MNCRISHNKSKPARNPVNVHAHIHLTRTPRQPPTAAGVARGNALRRGIAITRSWRIGMSKRGTRPAAAVTAGPERAAVEWGVYWGGAGNGMLGEGGSSGGPGNGNEPRIDGGGSSGRFRGRGQAGQLAQIHPVCFLPFFRRRRPRDGAESSRRPPVVTGHPGMTGRDEGAPTTVPTRRPAATQVWCGLQT